jgi:hypothetical protein
MGVPRITCTLFEFRSLFWVLGLMCFRVSPPYSSPPLRNSTDTGSFFITDTCSPHHETPDFHYCVTKACLDQFNPVHRFTHYFSWVILLLRTNGVRFPAGAWNFSLRQRLQTDSGAHAAPYPMGTGGSIPGSKAAGP